MKIKNIMLAAALLLLAAGCKQADQNTPTASDTNAPAATTTNSVPATNSPSATGGH